MTPDFRALCKEFIEICKHDRTYTQTMALVDRARAALATPPPEPPTDEELLRLYGVATPCYQVEEFKRELDFARAVLERWGK